MRTTESPGWTRAGLVLLLVIVAMAPIADPVLWEPDEGRYAEIGWEMLLTRDFLVPRLSGVEHLAKPPFAYWMVAAGTALVGPGAAGARLFVGVFAVLTVLVAMRLGRLLFDRATGLRAAMILATSLYGFVVTHYLSADLFVTFWQALGVMCAVSAWQSPPGDGADVVGSRILDVLRDGVLDQGPARTPGHDPDRVGHSSPSARGAAGSGGFARRGISLVVDRARVLRRSRVLVVRPHRGAGPRATPLLPGGGGLGAGRDRTPSAREQPPQQGAGP